MNMQEFIDENYEEIDEVLKAWGNTEFTDEDREDVINNDEGWYNYAIESGVEV
jgi:hypothetical protein